MKLLPYMLAAAMFFGASAANAQRCELERASIQTAYLSKYVPPAGNVAVRNTSQQVWAAFNTSCFSALAGFNIDQKENHATEMDINVSVPIDSTLGLSDVVKLNIGAWYFSYPNRLPDETVPDGQQIDIAAKYTFLEKETVNLSTDVHAGQIFGEGSGKGRVYSVSTSIDWQLLDQLTINAGALIRYRDRYYSDEKGFALTREWISLSYNLDNRLTASVQAQFQQKIGSVFPSVETVPIYSASLAVPISK